MPQPPDAAPRVMPRRRRRWTVMAAAGIVVALAWWGWSAAAPFLTMGTGFVAKYVGSQVFLSGRTVEDVEAEELSDHAWATIVSIEVGEDAVEASALGLISRRAVFRPGIGMTLLDASGAAPVGPESLPPQRVEAPQETEAESQQAVDLVLDHAFAAPAQVGLRSRAVIVRQDGRIVGERYAHGYDRSSVLQGWSMAKSVTGALVGVLVREGRLRIDQRAPVPEWAAQGDPRRDITLDQLLRMSSGLSFLDVYDDPDGDGGRMLFAERDMGAYAASQHLDVKPGQLFAYSSGTSNIVAGIIRRAAGDRPEDCLLLARRELFDPVGMIPAFLELDAAGNPVGSSYLHTTARGWSRFGELLRADGVCSGVRVLPEGWVEYMTTPTPPAPLGEFGAHLWLNRGRDGERIWPNVPADAYAAVGHAGQLVAVVPSRRAVITRLAADREGVRHDHDAFLRDLLDALD